MAKKGRVGLIDRVIGGISPKWGLERHNARVKLSRARNEYEGASYSRRTTGWRRSGRDANAELHPAAMQALRGIARDIVRNNPYGARGEAKLAEYMVGAGITFQIYRNGVVDKPLTKLARAHFDSTACDPAGQLNLYGLQLQAARTLITSGEVILRRRWRRNSDGLPVPFQIQVLEPDYFNTALSGPTQQGGKRVQGIEFDAIGRRVGYWLYSGHPGAVIPSSLETKLIPASEIAHCYRADRPEMVHGATWFAPVIVRIKDFGDYEDAQLVRQKIASCFTVFKVGSPDVEPAVDSNGDEIDLPPSLTAVEPGIIETLEPGEDVKFADPPGVDGYEPYSRVSLQAISVGLGAPYEIISGDLSNVSFISGRLGRLDFKTSIESWQWTMLLPQLCYPIGQWFLDAVQMAGGDIDGVEVRWTPPSFPMMSPETEIPATRDAIRSGQQTISGAARARGEDPDVFLEEWAADAARLDALGLVFDSDPRRVTAVGNPVAPMTPEQMNQRG